MAGVAAVGLNSVVVWPLLGRVAGAADLSTLIGVLAAAALVSPAVTLGTHAYVLRFLVHGSATERNRAICLAWVALAVFVGVATVGAIVTLWLGTTMLIGWATAQGLALIAGALVRGVDRPSLFAVHALVSQAGSIGVVALLLWASADARQAMAGGVAMILGSSALAIIGSVPRPEKAVDLRPALRFAIPLVPHLVLAVGSIQLIRLFIASFGSAQEAANFHYSALLAGAGLTTIQALSAHLTTDALRAEDVQFLTELSHATGRLYLVVNIFLAGLGIFAWTFLEIWLPDFLDVDIVTLCAAIMAVAVFAQVRGDIAMAALMRASRTGAVSAGTALGMLAGAATFFLLFLVPIDLALVGAVSVLMAVGVRAGVTAVSVGPAPQVRAPTSKLTRWGAVVGGAGLCALFIRAWG